MGFPAPRAPREDAGGGSALERLILDTTILVAVERRRGSLSELIGDDDDVAIAAISAAELLVGVELADSSHRRARQRYVESLLATVPVEAYDLDVARSNAMLLAHTQRVGRSRGAHDLLIAATGVARRRVVVTADVAGFADLPGVMTRSAE